MKNIKKVDAMRKLDGKVLFIDDIQDANLLHAKFVYSSKAHAKINKINFPKNFNLDEFIFVDAKDIPGKNLVENPVMTQPLFAEGEVEHFGQPIMGVAHKDKDTLLKFMEAVKVDYTELPAVVGIKNCLDNVKNAFPYDPKDAGNPFKSQITINNHKSKEIDPSWVKHHGVYYTPHQEQLYIEPQGVVAEFFPNEKRMFVKAACQCPYYIHEAIEIYYGDAIEKVEIEESDALGGAFGGKEDYPNILAGIASLISYKNGGGKVKLVLDREADIQITTKRHPSRSEITSYTDPKTGQMEKVDIDFRLDAGAFETHSPVVMARGALHAGGTYNCTDVKVFARFFKSNTPPNGAFRGFGAPQSEFAIEAHTQEIAKKIGISFLEFKNKNILRPNDIFPTTQVNKVDSVYETMKVTLEKSDYEKKMKEFVEYNKTHKIKKGIGISTGMHGGGFTGTGEKTMASKVRVNIDKDAIVRIYVSSTDMGQGCSTSLPQCFSEEIGHPLSKTFYQTPNTQKAPNSGPTVASRTIYIVGNLLRKMAKELVNEDFGGKKIEDYVTANQDQFPKDFYKTFELDPSIQFDVATYKGMGYGDFSWGCSIIEIEYDPDTYQVDVKKSWSGIDVGRRVNQEICEGQIQGGVLQAIGWGSTEYIERGNMRGSSITDYIAYTSADAPEMNVYFTDNDASKPKGLGELPMDFPASAITDALHNATGIFLPEIPVIPENIRNAIKK